MRAKQRPTVLAAGPFFIVKIWSIYLEIVLLSYDDSIFDYNLVIFGYTPKQLTLSSSPTVDFEEKTISDVTNVDLNLNTVTKIIFYDGSGKNKPITIENKQKIREFMGYLNNCVIKKVKNPILTTGWLRDAVFYVNDNKAMDITFNEPLIININDDFANYETIKGNLGIDKIDQFLKTIDQFYSIH